MEKKTTQRIVGLLVIIALVIILMPLLLDKSDAVTQVASVKAPPLPDQPVPAQQATSNNANETAPESIDIPADIAEKISHEAVAMPSADKPADVAQTTAPTPDKAAETTSMSSAAPVEAKVTADSNIIPSTEPDANDAKPVVPSTDNANAVKALEPPVNRYSVIVNKEKPSAADKVVTTVDKKPLQGKIVKIKHAKMAAADKHLDSQKSGWAIQLGAFKNKENAVRLADKLKAAGYKTFTHEIKSANGHVQTRVYIGPEFQQASAAKLSSKVEEEMKMHGLVVSYKSLS